MDYNDNSSILGLTYACYKQVSRLRTDALYHLEESPRLTISERKNVNTIKIAEMHSNRIFHTLSYLLNPNSNINTQKIESYNIEVLMNEILSEFERMASAYTPLSVSFSSRLKTSDIISLSKTHFEFIMLNLLYCCIKPLQNKQCDVVKINISASETKDHIVFHIYDNNVHFNPDEVIAPPAEMLFSMSDNDENSASNLMALSICVAQKSAEDMNGRLTCSALKSSNRYDVYLPKRVDIPQYKMCSPAKYIPTYSYYNEILADIKLEYILTQVIESFEGEFEGVRQL